MRARGLYSFITVRCFCDSYSSLSDPLTLIREVAFLLFIEAMSCQDTEYFIVVFYIVFLFCTEQKKTNFIHSVSPLYSHSFMLSRFWVGWQITFRPRPVRNVQRLRTLRSQADVSTFGGFAVLSAGKAIVCPYTFFVLLIPLFWHEFPSKSI